MLEHEQRNIGSARRVKKLRSNLALTLQPQPKTPPPYYDFNRLPPNNVVQNSIPTHLVFFNIQGRREAINFFHPNNQNVHLPLKSTNFGIIFFRL